MKSIAENLRSIADLLEKEDHKVKKMMCQTMIDDINELDELLILSRLVIISDQKSDDPPYCSLIKGVLKYDEDGLGTDLSLGKHDLSQFLITQIEDLSIAGEDFKYLLRGVINYLIATQTTILKHFDIGPEYYNENENDTQNMEIS